VSDIHTVLESVSSIGRGLERFVIAKKEGQASKPITKPASAANPDPDDLPRRFRNGPISNEREKLDTALTWLERGLILAGGIVVAGLLMESGPGIIAALMRRKLPASDTMGGALVTIGVAAEVLLGILIAQKSHRVQELADSSITESKERAAVAEQAAAEANLLTEKERLERLKLEEDLSPRLFKSQQDAIERLSAFSGTAVVLEYLANDLESKRTAEQIAWVFQGARLTLTPRPNSDPDPLFREGVTVTDSGVGSPSVGNVIIDELNKTGIVATRQPGIGREAEITLVRVGMKPSPEQKKITEQLAVIDRTIRESMLSGGMPDLSALTSSLTSTMRPGQTGNRVVLPNR
jgi:hypothetical protein